MTDYRNHAYRSADGRLDLFARDYPGGSEGDTPLLLMHGLTRNSADFEPLAGILSGRFRLIVPDQRGRGRSAWDDQPVNYRPDVYAADMFALLDSLGIGRVAIIGTSMGGLIAMVMVAMQPERIAGIVFNDVGPEIDPAGLARIQGYVGKGASIASWQDAAALCAETNGSAFPDFTEKDWLDFARRTCRETDGGEVVLDYDPAIAASSEGDDPATVPPDLWPMWAMLDVSPVLVVRGASSDLLAADTVKRMGERHSGPFTAVEIPNRAHAPLLDEPDAVAAIEVFLARIAG
ncbi:MAG: alpha/beta hydrolase [Novosphingobium sp.]|nr:alpha/beta hydrolase [Novosphingobium sp.]